MEFFKYYSVILRERVGEEKASSIIGEAIFFSCAKLLSFAHQEKAVQHYPI
jgi:hypothetical protein